MDRCGVVASILLLLVEIMQVTAESLIKLASEFAEQMMAKQSFIAPFWHVITADDEQMVVPPMSDDKDEATALMRVLLEVVEAKLCMFVTEAWQIEVPVGAAIPSANERLQHPSRKEVVLFQVEDIDDGETLGHRDIVRDAKGKPKLGPLEIERMRVSSGRIVGMLPTPRAERLQ